MSRPIDVKPIEAALRLGRLQLEADYAEQRRARMAKVEKEEFLRLIFQDLSRQAGDLYRSQLMEKR